MYEFTGMPVKYCPRCQEAEEKKYEMVRAYVKTHRGVSISEAAAQTGVPTEQILRYLKDGRLERMPMA